MPYYEIAGKWYHLSYSHSFTEVVSARTPRAAIVKYARGLDGYEEEDDIYWDLLPQTVAVGQQEPEPTFWVGDDQMYKVRPFDRLRTGTWRRCGRKSSSALSAAGKARFGGLCRLMQRPGRCRGAASFESLRTQCCAPTSTQSHPALC